MVLAKGIFLSPIQIHKQVAVGIAENGLIASQGIQ